MCYVVVGVPICIFIRSRNVSFHISLLLSNINVRLLLQVSRRLLTFSELRFYIYLWCWGRAGSSPMPFLHDYDMPIVVHVCHARMYHIRAYRYMYV